jgi:ribosomal-protein-alanine N-acetyltransferase
MPLKDQTNLFWRGPVMKALRSRIRRIIGMGLGQQMLRMPVLETERLILRKVDREDLKDIIAWEDVPIAGSAEVQAQEFLAYCFREYRERGIGPWGLQLRETNAIVGNCGLPHIIVKTLCGEVNCYVAPRHRGRGLATEALKALLEFGFRDIGLARIQARCELSNLSSQRLTQKVGMTFEGLVEDDPSSNDPGRKQKMYSILRKDFNLAVADCVSEARAHSDGRS